jgi:hypothetical protein
VARHMGSCTDSLTGDCFRQAVLSFESLRTIPSFFISTNEGPFIVLKMQVVFRCLNTRNPALVWQNFRNPSVQAHGQLYRQLDRRLF